MTDQLSPATSQREQAMASTSFRAPDELTRHVAAELNRAIEANWVDRIWDRDPSIWTDDERVAATISDRLGWLEAPATFRERVEELEAFASGVRAEGLSHAIVCGMGGSSLAPEVLLRSFPKGPEGIDLLVLDSTDPVAVAAAGEVDPERALYLIATKSGTTTETLAFLETFWELQDRRHGPIPETLPGQHFVAITDPGGSLAAIPHADLFRSVFLNPPDVGGRYSALTYVGLVPAALLDLDLGGLLNDASLMAERCREPEPHNPGLWLGVALGSLAAAGHDKLTLVLEPSIAPLGAWLEQLIAESTGKRDVGIVPIDGEPLSTPEAYGSDRVFVRLATAATTTWRATTDQQLDALAQAGHPVIDLTLRPGESLGGEFFRWEFATAIAGAVLSVNPFDEPNVAESKEATRQVLASIERSDGHLPSEAPLAALGPLQLIGDAGARLTDPDGTFEGELARHIARARPNGYLALQAYFAPSSARDEALTRLRSMLHRRTRLATTVGYGPRFLHSTGQLHKGGAPIGCFIQLTADHPQDVPIPRRESFGTLIDAQAAGDFATLERHDLPVLRVHLGADPDDGLERLIEAFERALPSSPR